MMPKLQDSPELEVAQLPSASEVDGMKVLATQRLILPHNKVAWLVAHEQESTIHIRIVSKNERSDGRATVGYSGKRNFGEITINSLNRGQRVMTPKASEIGWIQSGQLFAMINAESFDDVILVDIQVLLAPKS